MINTLLKSAWLVLGTLGAITLFYYLRTEEAVLSMAVVGCALVAGLTLFRCVGLAKASRHPEVRFSGVVAVVFAAATAWACYMIAVDYWAWWTFGADPYGHMSYVVMQRLWQPAGIIIGAFAVQSAMRYTVYKNYLWPGT